MLRISRFVFVIFLILLLLRISNGQQPSIISNEPGLDDARIVIGTSIPSSTVFEVGKRSYEVSGGLVENSKFAQAILTAYFDELNSQGGINGRKVELKVARLGPMTARADLDQFLKTQHVFAFVGNVIAGSRGEVFGLVRDRSIPLVGPITFYPDLEPPLNRQVFYLSPGVETQSRALVHLIATSEKFKKQRIGIVHSTDSAGMRVFAAVKDQLAKENLVATRIVAVSPSAFDSITTARQLQITNCEVVLSLVHAENSFQLLKEAAKLKWYPSLLINNLASSAAFELPIEFNHKIYFSLPLAPSDQSQSALADLGILRDKYHLSSEHIAIQLAALAAAKTFVEAMKNTGPAPTREKLISSLEALNNYSNGLTPLLTFGPNRRMGAQGAHISTVDLENQKFVPSPGWVELK